MGFIKEQIKLIKTKDPAIKNSLEVFLYPSFKVLLYHKIAHRLYLKKHFFLARWLAEEPKEKTGIEIHPCAITVKTFLLIMAVELLLAKRRSLKIMSHYIMG